VVFTQGGKKSSWSIKPNSHKKGNYDMENRSFDIARWPLIGHARVPQFNPRQPANRSKTKPFSSFFYFFAAFVLLFAQVLGPTQRAVPTARVHHRAASEPPLKRNSDHVGLRQRR
jgi:hypothetical protein